MDRHVTTDNVYFNKSVDYLDASGPGFYEQDCQGATFHIFYERGTGPWEKSDQPYPTLGKLSPARISQSLDNWGPAREDMTGPYWGKHQMHEYVERLF